MTILYLILYVLSCIAVWVAWFACLHHDYTLHEPNGAELLMTTFCAMIWPVAVVVVAAIVICYALVYGIVKSLHTVAMWVVRSRTKNSESHD